MIFLRDFPFKKEVIYHQHHDKQLIFTIILMIMILLPVNESTEGATILPRAAHIRDMYPRVALKYLDFSHAQIAPITLLKIRLRLS